LLEVLLLTYDQTGRGTKKNFEMEFIHKTNLKAAANYIDLKFAVNKVIYHCDIDSNNYLVCT